MPRAPSAKEQWAATATPPPESSPAQPPGQMTPSATKDASRSAPRTTAKKMILAFTGLSFQSLKGTAPAGAITIVSVSPDVTLSYVDSVKV